MLFWTSKMGPQALDAHTYETSLFAQLFPDFLKGINL